MSNMESLYKSFKYYFDYDKKKIKHFLDVLKNVKEEKWEYECNKKIFFNAIIYKSLKYDNIEINYKYFITNDNVSYNNQITVIVNNKIICVIDDETSELAIEIIDFIERVEKRAKGQK